MQQISSTIDNAVHFLSRAKTTYHAVAETVTQLNNAGFRPLDPKDNWSLKPNDRCYIVKNGTVVALTVPTNLNYADGFRMVAAHTDSPCLKVKPQPQFAEAGVQLLGLDVYGGAILNTWFDRDLTIAGKVVAKSGDKLQQYIVDFGKAIGVVPNVAIHLNREVNNGIKISRQNHLNLVATTNKKFNFNDFLLAEIQKQDRNVSKIYSYDLNLVDCNPASLIGMASEFLASSRIDNLLSCAVALESLLQADSKLFNIMVLYDHEEVGSVSNTGAASDLFKQIVQRIINDDAIYARCIANSLCLSVDGAHALHPNFLEKYEPRHAPLINQGVVLKSNVNQRYGTDSSGFALITQLAEAIKIPLQQFVVHSDLSCGTTIGPITASQLGVDVIDLGVAQWAMHSSREMAGCSDVDDLKQLLIAFYRCQQLQYG